LLRVVIHLIAVTRPVEITFWLKPKSIKGVPIIPVGSVETIRKEIVVSRSC
jgi:hypothetical protein